MHARLARHAYRRSFVLSVRRSGRRDGSKRSHWSPPAPTQRAPEAEWGYDEALTASILDLAKEKNWRVVEMRFEDPESFSFVTAAIYKKGRLLGVDKRRYPRDFATFVRFDRALSRLRPQYELPPPMPLAQFEAGLQTYGSKHGVNVRAL